MSAPTSISELLNLSKSQYRVYDLGRKIDKISKNDFNKVELNQLPYPFPIQGHASLAIAFWQKSSPQPYLWFVKLPLDERGLLNQGARDHFIAIIIEALGSDLTIDPNEKQEELLKSNPYLFTPSQYKLAMLNSILSADLRKPASEHFTSFINYLKKEDWQDWHNIGLQGISDFVVQIEQKENEFLFIHALEHLPEQVLTPLCNALENIKLSLTTTDTIISYFHKIENEKSDFAQRIELSLLRSLSASIELKAVADLFDNVLSRSHLPTDLLITIAGRCWKTLSSPEQMMQYLELLVKSEQIGIFSAIFKDLVAIPTIRPILFQCMRAQSRSDELAKAIGQLFQPNK